MIPPSHAKRLPGRPRLYSHLFTVYVDDEMDGQIRAWAQRSGVPIAVALREILEFGLEGLKEPA